MKPFPSNFWSILSYRNSFLFRFNTPPESSWDASSHHQMHSACHLVYMFLLEFNVIACEKHWNYTIQGCLRLSFLRLMYSTAVQIAKTYENYLELSWIQVLMYFYIYVMVSRIDSCFFGGGSQHMVLVHQAFRKSLLNFLWTSCDISWFSFVFLRNLYAFLMHFLCSSFAFLMHFLCNYFAFLMQFVCISYALLMHSLCTSYAVLMQF